MRAIENNIIRTLTEQGASLIRFVDITGLPPEQNRGLPHAICFGVALTPPYVQKVKETPDYVQEIVAQQQVEKDEFYLTEHKAGELADQIAAMLLSAGYQAYSQSDSHLIATGAWNEKNLETLLPHKTIAVLAGVGWIGKNNLLITPEYGPALCVGTVLTDAPLSLPASPIAESQCGTCRQCATICPTKALYGRAWKKHLPREDRVEVHKCTTCMKCLVHCRYTGKYLGSQVI